MPRPDHAKCCELLLAAGADPVFKSCSRAGSRIGNETDIEYDKSSALELALELGEPRIL